MTTEKICCNYCERWTGKYGPDRCDKFKDLSESEMYRISPPIKDLCIFFRKSEEARILLKGW